MNEATLLVVVVVAVGEAILVYLMGYFRGLEEGRRREHQRLQEVIDSVNRSLPPKG